MGIQCTCTSYWENRNSLLRKCIVPAAICVIANLMEFGLPGIAEKVTGRKFSIQLQISWVDELWWNSCVVVAGSGWQSLALAKSEESLKQNLQNNPISRKRPFFKHFWLIVSSNLRYQTVVAVSGCLEAKVFVVDDDLSSHERYTYLTTSLNENCIKFDFQTDWNYYEGLR